jgi:uncharacterized protein (DUF433 family)
MRIRVTDVLELLATGMSVADTIEELPDLEVADVLAVLKYAADRVDHPILIAV